MSRSKTGPVEILARASWLEELIEKLPRVSGASGSEWPESRKRYEAVVAECRAEIDQAVPPISARNDTGTFLFSSMGIRSTSTMGFEHAARNWIRLARIKTQEPDRTL